LFSKKMETDDNLLFLAAWREKRAHHVGTRKKKMGPCLFDCCAKRGKEKGGSH